MFLDCFGFAFLCTLKTYTTLKINQMCIKTETNLYSVTSILLGLRQFTCFYVKHLTPSPPPQMSDQHLISPYIISPELNIKATRKKEVITNWRNS